MVRTRAWNRKTNDERSSYTVVGEKIHLSGVAGDANGALSCKSNAVYTVAQAKPTILQHMVTWCRI